MQQRLSDLGKLVILTLILQDVLEASGLESLEMGTHFQLPDPYHDWFSESPLTSSLYFLPCQFPPTADSVVGQWKDNYKLLRTRRQIQGHAEK